jgi:antibiotic biosynthesis monooxygenase (ABM) superfamily enzyme
MREFSSTRNHWLRETSNAVASVICAARPVGVEHNFKRARSRKDVHPRWRVSSALLGR